ncbi:fibronectin type III domain-containing protein [Nocardioides anomalus]|uniref:hypothetical protein n=1 Tax=Nocardioides anomalus TaxID=2712223 RepID=UPI001E3D10E8|nr:hypothetical protein [Nocardioides anomalus]
MTVRPHPARARRAALLVLLIALVLGTATALGGPAQAAGVGTPDGLQPQGGVTDVNPVLSWSPVKGATSYDVQVSANGDYSSPVYDQGTVNTHATPTEQLPMTKLYWRVRARKDGETGGWANGSFSRNKLAGPTLLAPDDGATLAQPSQAPLLRWNPVAGATSYTVEVDKGATPDWVDSRTAGTRGTSMVWAEGSQQDVGTYSWRVTATVGSGQTTFSSAARSYTIGTLGAITVTSPAPDAQVEQVVFGWNPLPGAMTYDIRVSTDDSFNTIIDQRNLRGTRFSPPKTYDVDDYWWQVRPRSMFDKAPDWTTVPVRHFQRTWEGAGAVPVLTYPANALSPTVPDDFYYQWTPARLASRYRLDVGPNQNFSPGTYDSCFTTQTTFVPFALNGPGAIGCQPGPGQVLYWRVKALDGAGSEIQGVYSAISKFVYNPGHVEVISPKSGSVDIPTLRWKPFLDAEHYRVTISWNGGAVVADTKSLSYTPTSLDPANSPFSWTVQAYDAFGTSNPIELSPPGHLQPDRDGADHGCRSPHPSRAVTVSLDHPVPGPAVGADAGSGLLQDLRRHPGQPVRLRAQRQPDVPRVDRRLLAVPERR